LLELACGRRMTMEERDIRALNEELQAFRNRVKKMVDESMKEARKHVTKEELPLEIPFHEGEAGGYEIVLSLLEDLPEKASPTSLNTLEEIYLGLLLDYKRIKGGAAALETVLTEMQQLFDLPSEKDVEQSERLAKKVMQYSAKSGQAASGRKSSGRD
jgi:hypothetical protein